MKWLAIVGVVFVAAAIIIVIIGTLLPRNHVVTMRARITATPDAVWSALTDIANQASWRPDVQRIELLPEINGKTAWREQLRHGAITMVIDRAQPPTQLVTRIADDKLPFGGSWTYAIVPDSDATIVTITENGSVTNPIFRFVSRFVLGHTATMDAYLRALSRKFGSESVPTVVALSPTSN